jgi:hypothetical protein
MERLSVDLGISADRRLVLQVEQSRHHAPHHCIPALDFEKVAILQVRDRFSILHLKDTRSVLPIVETPGC